MNLWIRNQDRKCLSRPSFLYIEKASNLYYICNREILFGKYETEERALEVLDEIQNLLTPQVIVEDYDVTPIELCDGTKYIKPSMSNMKIETYGTYVYQMPED